MVKQPLKYAPDYAVAPGATLKEILDDRGISQTAFSVRAGLTEKNVSQIINGVAPITYEAADKFELVLGAPASFWNKREQAFREALTRNAATERMKADVAWLEEIPVDALRERGFFGEESDKASLVRHALKFFGVSSVDAWREAWGNPIAQYRGGEAKEKRPGHVAAWLRIGELQAEAIDAGPFNADEFRRALADVRNMTRLPANKWVLEVPARCVAAGVAVVFTKEIKSAAVSGATRWAKDKAIIQLSLKFKSDDQIWFSFFHEAGHIVLHGRKRLFVEFGADDTSEEEREANAFARDQLIPQANAGRLPYLKKNRDSICKFAEEIGVSPGIVVGRLQKDGLVYRSAFTDLKRRVDWSN